MKRSSKKHLISNEFFQTLIRVWSLLLISALLVSASCGCGRNGTGSESTSSPKSAEAQTDRPPETSEDPPKIIFTPSESEQPGQYPNYTFRILERTDGQDSLLSPNAAERINAVHRQTEASIEVSSDPEPVKKAESALLSGAAGYDALFLPLTDLSSLLRSGNLENLAELGIDPAAPGLNILSAESLAVNGKYYIAFGDLSPSSINSVYAMLCNLQAALSNEINAIFGKDIRSAALDGDLTLEKLLQAYADAPLITSSTSTDMVLRIPSTDASLASLSLLAAMGGEIFDMSSSPARLALSESSFADAYAKAVSIYKGAGSEGSAVFTVQKFSTADEQQCYLPIPKINADAPYRCLADPKGVYGWSVPLGAESGKRTREISCALFKASDSYANDFLTQATGNETEAAIAELILSSAVCSVAQLYDWGDLSQLTADGIIRGIDVAGILGDSSFEKKAAAAAQAIEIFTGRLN